MSHHTKAPLAMVTETFKTKEALVAKLVDLVKKDEGTSKDEIKQKLSKASNKQLLKLHKRLAK